MKYVSLDVSYKRGLMMKHERENNNINKGGAFVDGNKRPGKIFTKMSFCEAGEEEDTGNRNNSIKWGRQLLLQVNLFFIF